MKTFDFIIYKHTQPSQCVCVCVWEGALSNHPPVLVCVKAAAV